jgi:hypothetical protein
VSRATDQALDALHGLLSEALADSLRRAVEASRLPKDHQNYAPIPASLLLAVRQFLKDNGIDAPASSPRFNDVVDELRKLQVGPEHAN